MYCLIVRQFQKEKNDITSDTEIESMLIFLIFKAVNINMIFE